ncbi:MAG: aminoglycoside phosphotransferase family protein [Eubacteriales bacterium]|nr:aminoglycoside phosphotransferase family protein [Eubacteriales bacterium]
MASDKFTLKEICSEFDIKTDIEAYGNGHINDTYLCDTAPRFILQRLNTNVFKDPVSVMENIVNVTEHLSKKITAAGGDPTRETLTVIPTKSGCSYFKADENNYFRMYKFIEDSMSYDLVENPIQLYHAGTAFGKFQSMLSDFSADRLHETIVDFHNTPKRVEQLNDAISNNAANRADSVRAEIDFAKEYAKYASAVIDKMNDGSVPLRVTHNDTKLNNVLFDKETGEGLCVIDLDTVMPGSVLFDFGDALRFGASSGSEDETDLDKIWFDLEKFEQFAKGFLSQTADCLTDAEIELLPLSALLLTYECGIRFLADYLNGDTYFKIHRENHNLDRCRTQFKLVADIEKKLPQMAEIVKKYI